MWPAFLATLLLRPGATTPAFSPASGDSLAVVIAEVLYDPRPGDTAFVELLNVGAKPVDLTAMVLRVDTLDLPLPRLDAPFGPGARAVVRFDGRGGIEASTIHASPGYSRRREAGTLALLRNDGVRDNSESSNFSDGDDVCEQLDGSVSYAVHAVNPTSGARALHRQPIDVQLSGLRPDRDRQRLHHLGPGNGQRGRAIHRGG